jgi:hypothetical protein
MTSIEQIAANIKNGARSRGPRTATGKARSSRNARSHGLTVSIPNDSAVQPEAEKLAVAIAGANANIARLTQARTIAETQLALFRIRDAQIKLMDSACATPHTASEGPEQGALSTDELLEVVPQLVRWLNYERKVLSRLKRAMRGFIFDSAL